MTINEKKTIYTVLAVSIVLNGFLAGFIMARLPDGGPPGPMRGGPQGMMMEMVKVLPDDQQEKVRTIITDNMATSQVQMETMHTYFPQIRDILTAPTFDPEALKTVAHKLDAADTALKQSMLGMMTAIATALPDADRITFFDHMPLPPAGPPP